MARMWIYVWPMVFSVISVLLVWNRKMCELQQSEAEDHGSCYRRLIRQPRVLLPLIHRRFPSARIDSSVKNWVELAIRSLGGCLVCVHIHSSESLAKDIEGSWLAGPAPHPPQTRRFPVGQEPVDHRQRHHSTRQCVGKRRQQVLGRRMFQLHDQSCFDVGI